MGEWHSNVPRGVSASDIKVGQKWARGIGRPHLRNQTWKVTRIVDDRVFLARERGGKILQMDRSFGSFLANWVLKEEADG